MNTTTEGPAVAVLPRFFPRQSECIVCGTPVFDPKLGIAMSEGDPVPHDWTGDWGGFDACRTCFHQFEAVQADPVLRTRWFKIRRWQSKQNNPT